MKELNTNKKIAARSDEWTAFFCFRFEKEKSAVLYVAPIINLTSVEHVVRPQFALRHNCLNCVLHTFGRISVAFQQLLNQHTHSCSCRVFFLPINRLILTQGFGKLF